MLRLFPAAALLLLIGPVAAGLFGVALPALGFLPVLGRGDLSLQPMRDLMAMPGIVRSAALSFGTGLAATAIAFVLVVLVLAGWRGTRAFRLIERLISPLLSVPHAAAAFGIAFLVAPSGFLARLVSPWASGWDRPPDLLIVHDGLGIAMTAGLAVKELPFLLLIALAALPQTRAAEIERASAALGYGRILGFVHGVLPGLYGQMRLAVFAVLAYATSVVDVAMILGPTLPAPLAVRILDWQRDADLDMHLVAAAGAVLQIGVTAAALLVWIGSERLCAALVRWLAASGWRGREDAALRFAGGWLVALSACAVLAGMALLALWSAAGPWRFPDALPSALSLAAWRQLAGDVAVLLRHTLLFGLLSALIAVVLALGALEYEARSGRRRTSGALTSLFVPLLVPQVSFLFGLQILFSTLGWDGHFLAVLLVHLVFVFPYVFLSLSDPWWHWDPRYGQVVEALGRSRAAVFWRVRLPMLSRAVLTALALGFAVSVALYLPTLLVGAGRWPTVTTEAVALASGGARSLTGATALVQAVLPFLGFALALAVPAVVFRNRRALRAGG